MARPVRCRIIDMPDGHFAVMAGLASGSVFRRMGFATLGRAVDCLRAVMAACSEPVVVEVSTRSVVWVKEQVGQAAGSDGF